MKDRMKIIETEDVVREGVHSVAYLSGLGPSPNPICLETYSG